MVHSIELVFDPDTEATVRQIWDELREAGLPSQTPSSRPHVTLTVAERIDSEADEQLRVCATRLPLACRVGAPMLFGGSALTLVRLIVPSAGLLALHEAVDALGAPHMTGGPFVHSRPGGWTPHVTLCRRLASADVGAALDVIGAMDIAGTFVGLRRWDGNERIEYPI
jgi:hypothetical protein